ncbi:MAG: histidinol-phosphate transaminase [Chloroflexota bacterium]
MVDEAVAPKGTTRRPARPVHGGVKPAELRALGLTAEEVLDFSASVSPLGPPQGVWEALRRVDLAAYPDPACLKLREALSHRLSGHGPRRESVAVERILVGNGSTEVIHLLARAYLSPPRPGTTNSAFLLTPTYGEYEGACGLAGASVSGVEARRCAGFSWDLEEACCRIAAQRPSLAFLCNPNNPTGVYLRQRDVEALAEATAAAGGLLVVDEAYVSFVDHPWDSLALLDRDNVLLLRSMTKDYALTGLRLGYSLATEEVTRRLASFQPDWSVNGLAQAAGLVALADMDYLPRARKTVAEAKEYLTAQLTSLGFTVLPSAANFLLVQVGDGATWREKLMHRGLFVRDCASFGLPDCIRVGIRPLPDCQRLVRAMAEVV